MVNIPHSRWNSPSEGSLPRIWNASPNEKALQPSLCASSASGTARIRGLSSPYEDWRRSCNRQLLHNVDGSSRDIYVAVYSTPSEKFPSKTSVETKWKNKLINFTEYLKLSHDAQYYCVINLYNITNPSL